MRIKEITCVVLILLGFGSVIGGHWLIWDWINSIVRFLDWNKFFKEWCFWLPYFIECIRADRWTLAYDIALGWIIIGIFMLSIGLYYLGKLRE